MSRRRKTNTNTKLKSSSTSSMSESESESEPQLKNQGSKTSKKVYECKSPGCKKQFGFSSHLTQHEKTHVKQKDTKKSGKIEVISIESSDSDSNSDSDSRSESEVDSQNESVSEEEENLVNSKNTKNSSSSAKSSENQKETTPVTSTRWSKKGGQFACNLCPATMKTKSSLSKHLKTHNGLKPFACDQCSFRSNQRGNVKVHVMKVHSGLRPFKCPEPSCSYATNTKDHLNSHLRSHRQAKDFKCTHPSCSYACNQASALRTHMLIHSGQRPYPCKLCGHKSRTAGALRSHMFTHTGEKSTHCPYSESGCEYACQTSSTMAVHIRSIHTKEKPYGCPHPGCDFKSAQKPNLNTHLKIRHSSNQEKFKCNLCDYSGRFKGNLEAHVRRRHTKEGLSKFKCEWEGCSFVATLRTTVKTHQLVHTKERNHECDICHKKFGLRRTLMVHMAVHNDEKRYKCELCDYRSKQRGNVQGHMITAHTGEEKLAKCPEKGCGYAGKTAGHLKSHLKSHQKKRNFRCSVSKCGFKCKVFHAYRIHLNEHRENGEK